MNAKRDEIVVTVLFILGALCLVADYFGWLVK